MRTSTDSAARAKAKTPGRGARSNASGRYELIARAHFDDGWSETAPASPNTSVNVFSARKLLTFNSSPDISFDRSINPYKGCEHGCSYCYARPNHAYLGLSPGLDFETKLFWKPDAPELLERELRKPGYRAAPVALGADTDPYQPIERALRSTRAILDVLARFNHPVLITTKGALVARDIDLLGPMAEQRLAAVAMSVTTLNPALARAMEPRAPTPKKKLAAISALADAGVPVKVMTAPIIPGLNDHEVETILSAAADAGATSASYVMLRLPLEIETLFQEWLADFRPAALARVMRHVRDMRGGAAYDPTWFKRQRGDGPYAKLVAQRFNAARKRYGLDREAREVRADLFNVPPQAGDQMDMFGV